MTLPRGNDYPRETPRYAVEVWRDGDWVVVRDRLLWSEARRLVSSYRAADLARIVTR